MTNRIHPKTAAAAQTYAKEKLGVDDAKLRPATAAEQLRVKAKLLDNEMVVDAVVARDAGGNEHLLGVVDDALSKRFNDESALAMMIGLVPVVGPPVAATLALIDIGRSGIPMMQAKIAGEATHPGDRALLRMGLKHLTISAASLATHGLAHQVMMGVEGAALVADGVDSRPKLREMQTSLIHAVRGLLNVKFLDHSGRESLRVVLIKELGPSAEAAEAAEAADKGQGNPEETNGPGAG